ncbi:MAG: hypothetical protein HOM21_10570 [Halobacteriovoraceae bacterium]|nr:hypothetical protein [Halobacteriovoraceae bacterium]
MKKFLMTILILVMPLISASGGGLKSPFAPTVDYLSIPNSHTVGSADAIVRGMAPGSKVAELVEEGFTDVLIFKSQTRSEVDDEVAELLALGIKSQQIHKISFPWRRFESYQSACQKTVQALKLFREIQADSDRSLFFHCTVGEDRTGHLTGLWRMLNQNWSAARAFRAEMCARGFGRGNPHKPSKVVKAIRAELTPLFFAMAKLVTDGQMTLDNLDLSVCQNLEIIAPAFSKCRVSELSLE